MASDRRKVGQENDKKIFRQDNITTYRERKPTSRIVVERGMTNMAIDFAKQEAFVPMKLGATMSGSRTMNHTGRAAMGLNAMVGGAPEQGGLLAGPPPKSHNIRANRKGKVK